MPLCPAPMSITREKYSDSLHLLNFGAVELVLFVMEGEGTAFPNHDESKGNLCWPQAFPAGNSRHRDCPNCSASSANSLFHIASPQTTALPLEAYKPTYKAQQAPLLCFFSSCLPGISLKTLLCSAMLLHPLHVSSAAGWSDLFSTQAGGKTLSLGQGKAAHLRVCWPHVILQSVWTRSQQQSQCSISLR